MDRPDLIWCPELPLGWSFPGTGQPGTSCLDPAWLPPAPSSLWLQGRGSPFNWAIWEWTGRATGMDHYQTPLLEAHDFLVSLHFPRQQEQKVIPDGISFIPDLHPSLDSTVPSIK